jgi:hypothetical protein
MKHYCGDGPLMASVEMRLEALREGTAAMLRNDANAFRRSETKFSYARERARQYHSGQSFNR